MISERLKTPAQRIAFLSLCLSLVFFILQVMNGDLGTISRSPKEIIEFVEQKYTKSWEYFSYPEFKQLVSREERRQVLDEILIYLNIAWIIASFILTLWSSQLKALKASILRWVRVGPVLSSTNPWGNSLEELNNHLRASGHIVTIKAPPKEPAPLRANFYNPRQSESHASEIALGAMKAFAAFINTSDDAAIRKIEVAGNFVYSNMLEPIKIAGLDAMLEYWRQRKTTFAWAELCKDDFGTLFILYGKGDREKPLEFIRYHFALQPSSRSQCSKNA